MLILLGGLLFVALAFLVLLQGLHLDVLLLLLLLLLFDVLRQVQLDLVELDQRDILVFVLDYFLAALLLYQLHGLELRRIILAFLRELGVQTRQLVDLVIWLVIRGLAPSVVAVLRQTLVVDAVHYGGSHFQSCRVDEILLPPDHE